MPHNRYAGRVSLDVPPLERTRLVDEVTDRLRRLIIEGTLEPGQALLQNDLSERLGVSRTPLREAFRVLEREGFVRVSNGNNTLEVIELTTPDMIELYQMREVVDGLAARLAAQRGISDVEYTELVGLIDAMSEMTERYDPSERAGHHADLHSRIAELSGNRHVIAQIPMIRFTAQMLARRLKSLRDEAPEVTFEMIEHGADDHHGVVEAIRAGDAKAAETIARRHIRKTMRSPLLIEDRRSARV
jgi:GntR family transcriptional regulator of vanillate catabolism